MSRNRGSNLSTNDANNQSKSRETGLHSESKFEQKYFLYVGLTSVVVVLILFAALLCGIFYRRKSKTGKRRKRVYNELLKNCKQNPSTDVLSASDFVRKADAMIHNESLTKKFLEENVSISIRTDSVDEWYETITVESCRYPEIECAKMSCIRVKTAGRYAIHMNRLCDYFGSPLYISQAPMVNEFSCFWQAIIQENIGVLVWLGPTEEKGEEKIVPYIPMEETACENYGRYKIQNIKTMNDSNYNLYKVQVSTPSTNKMHPIQLICVHVPKWSCSSGAFAAAIIHHVQSYQKEMKCFKLPGVLVHCSDGIRHAPTFCAAYIASQMLISKKKVNVAGIMRFIRKYRYNSFEKTEYACVRNIFDILKSVLLREVFAK